MLGETNKLFITFIHKNLGLSTNKLADVKYLEDYVVVYFVYMIVIMSAH